MLKKISFYALALFLLLGPESPGVEAAPPAQSGNLIVNSGFETTGGSTGAASWLPWWSEIAKPADESLNYAYKPSWNVDSLNNNDAQANIYAGSNSQRVVNNWDPWYAGVKQVVSAPAGAKVRLTAYGKLWASAGDWPAPADTTINARMFRRIHPDGSENQFDNVVVWSGAINPMGGWQPVSVEATVGKDGKVGVFLAADYRGNSRKFMASYWDEISLVVVGASTGGNTPAPGATTAPQPTSAPVFLTPFTLPTPGPDGNIIYIVQPGDTLWRIAGIAGTTVDQIKAMNGLSSEIISVGQRLIIGKSAAAPTQPPAPTAAPDTGGATAAPNPTTAPAGTQVANVGAATVCAMLFEDVNGNARRDANEGLVTGGQFTVVDTTTGAPVQTYTTDGINEPHCFENLPAGAYTISSAAPAGFNATTASTTPLQLETGSLSNVEFGAQRSAAASGGAEDNAGSRSRLRIALFGAAGVMFLLLAAGVAGFLILRQQR